MRGEGRSSLPQPATGMSEVAAPARSFLALIASLLVALPLVASPLLAAEHTPAKAAKGEGAVDGPTFIKLPPIVLPVFNSENKVTRQAGLVLALELLPGKTAADVEPNRRQLQDTFITDLYTLYDQVGGAERVIDSALVKQRLQETSDRILGPGIVRAVLIQQAFERGRR
jgi:flagellar protein FliL